MDSPTHLNKARIVFPNHIIGRENIVHKIGLLKKEIESGKPKILYITGPENVGKSLFINSIFHADTNTHFFTETFESHNQLVPLGKIGRLIEVILNKLISTDPENKKHSKINIEFQNAFKEYYQELAEIVPNIDLYIDNDSIQHHHESPELKRNRFHTVLVKFFKFCTNHIDKPLVIFIENLQFINKETLNIIELIIEDNIPNLSIILSSRKTNEQEITDFLIRINDRINTIAIPPLSKEDIEQFLRVVFPNSISDFQQLVNYVYVKSNQNFYLVKEIILSLYRSNHIQFDASENVWKWKIIEHNLIENHEVLPLLLNQKLNSLDSGMQSTLQISSCFGANLNVPFISNITGIKKEELLETFHTAMKLDFFNENDVNQKSLNFSFKNEISRIFLYNSLDEKSKINIHKKIARYYIYDAIKVMDERDLFDALFHLNKSINNDYSLKDKQTHAELNLKAAIKSKNTSFYTFASQYIEETIRFDIHKKWNTHYELSAKIIIEGYQIYRLSGLKKKENSFYKSGLQHLKPKDLVNLYYSKLLLDIQFGDLESALKIGIKALKILGIHISIHANNLTVIKEIIKTKIALFGKSTDDIYNLKQMRDEKAMSALNIIFWLYRVAYNLNPSLNGVLALKSLQLTINKGTNGDSYSGLMAYGVIIGAGTNNLKLAYDYGEVGERISKKYNFETGELEFGKAVYTAFRYAIKDTLIHYERSKYMSYSNGDFLGAVDPTPNESLTYLSAGFNLNVVKDKVQENLEFCEQLGMIEHKNIQFIIKQHINSLQGVKMEDTTLNQINSIIQNTQYKFFSPIINILKLQYLCYHKKWDKCLDLIHLIKPEIMYLTGLYIQVEFYFYQSLVYAKLLPKASFKNKIKYNHSLKSRIKKMTKWSLSAPENYQHKLWIIEGLYQSNKGNHTSAIELYQSSANNAKTLNLKQNLALAYRFISESYLKQGETEKANEFALKSENEFKDWGLKV